MSLVRPKTSLNGRRSLPREQRKEDIIECEDDYDSLQLGIIKQFTFSSELQVSSINTKEDNV